MFTKLHDEDKKQADQLVAAVVEAATLPESNDRRNERSNERTNETKKERRKIRHTFDIFADQLLGLKEIALKLETDFGKKVLLGELVQAALDKFIDNEKTNVSTNER